jgi:Cellulase N-terminal ig-like domain
MHANQVAYDQPAPKFAVVETAQPLPQSSRFQLMDALTSKAVFDGTLSAD